MFSINAAISVGNEAGLVFTVMWIMCASPAGALPVQSQPHLSVAVGAAGNHLQIRTFFETGDPVAQSQLSPVMTFPFQRQATHPPKSTLAGSA